MTSELSVMTMAEVPCQLAVVEFITILAQSDRVILDGACLVLLVTNMMIMLMRYDVGVVLMLIPHPLAAGYFEEATNEFDWASDNESLLRTAFNVRK